MKRRMTFGMILALALVIGLTVTAMAAGPGPNANRATAPGLNGQGAAQHGTFVDEDGNGECDSYATRTPAQDGTGNRWGGGDGNQAGQGQNGSNFIDEDGDGVCDSCLGTGPQYRDGNRQGARRSGRGNR